jgi:hypothetical protein
MQAVRDRGEIAVCVVSIGKVLAIVAQYFDAAAQRVKLARGTDRAGDR